MILNIEIKNLQETINRLEGRIRNLEHWKERTENILFLKGITEGFKSADSMGINYEEVLKCKGKK